MATELEDLRVLNVAEKAADRIWKITVRWDLYARNVLGGQLARAADSVGANIAESYGRYHYGEKIRFLYFARGSLFETKYWLNRAMTRGLLDEEIGAQLATELSTVARQLNLFVKHLRRQRQSGKRPKRVREEQSDYQLQSGLGNHALFTEAELDFLSNLQSPVSSHPVSDA